MYSYADRLRAVELYIRLGKTGGFPADLVAEIKNVFGPETADVGA